MAGNKMYITEPFGGNKGATALPLARISYTPGLWKANDDGKYSVTLIWPKTELKLLQSKVAEVITNQWGEKGVDRFKKGLIKNPILDGDGKSAMNKKTGELNPGMGPDVKFIRPWSKSAIKCFGPNGLPMDAQDIKSGWWGYPVLTAFAWHNAEQGDGVGFWISMWMHAKEDEVLGPDSSGGDPSKFFDTVQTGDDGGASVGAGGAGDLFG